MANEFAEKVEKLHYSMTFAISELTEEINDLENEVIALTEIIDRLEGELAEAQAKVRELNEHIEEIPPQAYSQRRHY